MRSCCIYFISLLLAPSAQPRLQHCQEPGYNKLIEQLEANQRQPLRFLCWAPNVVRAVDNVFIYIIVDRNLLVSGLLLPEAAGAHHLQTAK